MFRILLIIILICAQDVCFADEVIWETTIRSITPSRVNTFVQSPEFINLNSADKITLMKLSGIGEKKANSIIEYRARNGPFKKIDELIKVKGFSKKIIATLKEKNKGIFSVTDG